MNEPDSIEETVLAVLGATLNRSEVQLRSDPVLASHNWDSLASLEALLALEQECGVKFDLRDFHKARRVDDLVALMMKATGRQPALS